MYSTNQCKVKLFSASIHCQFVINSTALANEYSIRNCFQRLNSNELTNLIYLKFDCNSTATFDSNSIQKYELSNIRQLYILKSKELTKVRVEISIQNVSVKSRVELVSNVSIKS